MNTNLLYSKHQNDSYTLVIYSGYGHWEVTNVAGEIDDHIARNGMPEQKGN